MVEAFKQSSVEFDSYIQLTIGIYCGAIRHPLLVFVPSSGMSRVMWSLPNVMGGAMS